MIERTSEPMNDTQGYLTPEQFDHLISFAKNERDKVLMTFFFYTGRRVSEVVRRLRPCDFNFRDNMIYFYIEKKRKEFRTWINVNSVVMDMMKKYIEKESILPDAYIFPINRFRVDQIIKEMSRKADMEYQGKHKLHVHMLRHSFAVMMAKRLKPTMNDARKLQALMAHSNIDSTVYYINHYNPEEMREFVNMPIKKSDKKSIEEKFEEVFGDGS